MAASAPANRKIDDQQLRLGDAGGLRRHIRIADRDQRAAEAAMGDIGAEPGGYGREARCRDSRSPMAC